MSIPENNIMTLAEVLEAYEEGTLDMTALARKCYLTEEHRTKGLATWVHNDELKNHLLFKSIGANNRKMTFKNKTK